MRWWQREGHVGINCSFVSALLMSICETWTVAQVVSKKIIIAKANNNNNSRNQCGSMKAVAGIISVQAPKGTGRCHVQTLRCHLLY